MHLEAASLCKLFHRSRSRRTRMSESERQHCHPSYIILQIFEAFRTFDGWCQSITLQRRNL